MGKDEKRHSHCCHSSRLAPVASGHSATASNTSAARKPSTRCTHVTRTSSAAPISTAKTISSCALPSAPSNATTSSASPAISPLNASCAAHMPGRARSSTTAPPIKTADATKAPGGRRKNSKLSSARKPKNGSTTNCAPRKVNTMTIQDEPASSRHAARASGGSKPCCSAASISARSDVMPALMLWPPRVAGGTARCRSRPRTRRPPA